MSSAKTLVNPFYQAKNLEVSREQWVDIFFEIAFLFFFCTFLHKLSICDRYVNLKCNKKLYLEHTSAHEYTAMRPQKWFHHIVQTQSGFNLLFFSLSKIGKRRKSWSWITKVQYSFCNSIQTNLSQFVFYFLVEKVLKIKGD